MIATTPEECSEQAEFIQAFKEGRTNYVKLPTGTTPKSFLPTNRHYRRKEAFAARKNLLIDVHGRLIKSIT